ncbi:hypothetical protein MNBD_ALPHA12-727 [hydrothermal vent metagenome]|uniref:Co-chaperone DjlA N-terminal domain-containing protein n=1 Tax=hydrothermal vent metagenome TaxID=652676 RepID=A0A3B0TK96_9ZZZZ
MFSSIARLFSDPARNANLAIDPKLAVAALLIHLTNIDGKVTPEENAAVATALKDHFELSEAQIAQLLEIARQKDADAVDFYRFTAIITRLDMEQRLKIIAMMWSVVYADDENHELEDNMVWRVAELIGVSARDRTTLRAKMKNTHGQTIESNTHS